jgi:hypothetical protein
MKRAFGLVLACLAAGSFAVAQTGQDSRSHSETTVKQKGPGPDTKQKMESVTGIVKDYDAGKKITVSGPGDKSYSFDLDENARVSGNIAVGQKVKVHYWKDNDGHERVSVISAASGSSVGEATMPRSHTETTMKQRVPDAPDTKVKTETVVGTVKEYEAGKKIVVTGPGNKDYRFDLDENASVPGPVAVGERVKVTYRKGEGGDKATVVSHWTGKS